MLTHVSNPTLRQWARMFSLRRYSEFELLVPWKGMGSVSGMLSKSTWSLGLIAEWRKNVSNSLRPVILLPDFFCETALIVVRAIGCDVVFYPIEENGLANISKLRDLCSLNQPDLLVMAHFFGTANSQATQFKEIASMHQAWLIEDCAHSVSPTGIIGSVGDFAIFSPHKLIPIPFGAILTARIDGPCELGTIVTSRFGDPKNWAEQISEAENCAEIVNRSLYLNELIWIIKRLTQRLGIARKSRTVKNYQTDVSSIKVGLVDPGMPWFSKRMLSFLVSKPKSNLILKLISPGKPSLSYLDQFAAIRQSNLPIWDEVVTTLSNGRVLPVYVNPIPHVPYLAAYCGDEDDVLNVLTEMERLGLPVCTWPDLPEVVHGDISTHKGAVNLRNRRIYLPLHHNIDASGVSRLLTVINKSRKIADDSVKLVEVTSPEVWRSYLMKIEFSNLLQAWEYGDAKALSEGWHGRRVVCSNNGSPLCIAQFLERKIFGIFKVSRLSRGPLFFNDSSDAQLHSAWKKILKSYSIWRLHILSISPELLVGNTLNPIHGLATLRRVSPVGTESATLNLNQEISTLRQNLDPKWRNQLTMSERSGTRVDYSTKESDFKWFEEVYETLRREKGFYGIPTVLFQNILKMFSRTGNAHLFICTYEGRNIAAILVVAHGTTATYLAGWNGHEGRKLNVNNLLLWEASRLLKEMGISKLDLGGIDSLNTPTIAKFKLGMRGKIYKTLGEFVKF